MEVKWVEHNSKRILYVDYRGAKSEDEMINVLMQSIEIQKKLPSKILVLANFQGTYGTDKYLQAVKTVGKDVRKEKVEKTALLGVNGIKKILYKSYIAFTGEKNINLFENEYDAMNWLIK